MNKRYWLRGGIILLLLVLVVLVFFYFFGMLKLDLSPKIYCVKAPCPSPPFTVNIFNIYLSSWMDLASFLSIVAPMLFLIGSFLGYLYGRIKNRHKITSG